MDNIADVIEAVVKGKGDSSPSKVVENGSKDNSTVEISNPTKNSKVLSCNCIQKWSFT